MQHCLSRRLLFAFIGNLAHLRPRILLIASWNVTLEPRLQRWCGSASLDKSELIDVYKEAPEFDHLSTDLLFRSSLGDTSQKVFPLKASSSPSIPSSLCGVPLLEALYCRNLQDQETKNDSLLRVLTHKSVLYRAVLEQKHRVRRLSRFMTPSRKLESLRVNDCWMDELAKLLCSNSFTFVPEKRLLFDIKHCGKTLNLAVPCHRDEIILNGMRLVLEAIYEPRLSSFSYGFRPGRGRQHALRDIINRFRGMDFYIVVDLSRALQTCRGYEMIYSACAFTHDPLFEKLMYKALDIGYINNYGLQEESFLSVTKEMGISPLVLNIFLNSFDKWMECFCQDFPKCMSLKHWPLTVQESPLWYRKLRYLRHGTTFFVGVRGNKSEANAVAGEIQWKLSEMKIDRSLLNIQVHHAYLHKHTSERALFLGYEISREEFPSNLNTALRLTYQFRARPLLYIPTLRLRECFHENSFIKLSKLKTWIPFGVGNISHWPVEHIVRYFDRLTSALLEYYALADNYQQLSWFVYLLKRSCSLSVGRKLRLRTMRKVFNKYGRDLEVKDGDTVVASLPDRSLAIRPIVNDFHPELTPYLRRRQHITQTSTKQSTENDPAMM